MGFPRNHHLRHLPGTFFLRNTTRKALALNCSWFRGLFRANFFADPPVSPSFCGLRAFAGRVPWPSWPRPTLRAAAPEWGEASGPMGSAGSVFRHREKRQNGGRFSGFRLVALLAHWFFVGSFFCSFNQTKHGNVDPLSMSYTKLFPSKSGLIPH